VKFSQLIAQGKKEESSKLVTDIFRIGFLVIAIGRALLFIFSRPLLNFLNVPDNLLTKCVQYLIPFFICFPFMSFVLFFVGIYQGQGKSIQSGSMLFGIFAIDFGIVAPILFFLIKVPFILAAFPQTLTSSVFGIILTILLFKNKFEINMDFSMLISRFSSETKGAIAMGLPFFMGNLFSHFSHMLQFRYTLKATSSDILSSVGSILSAYQNIY
jgi:Na+-driven multidrug efflux pump